MIFMIEHKIESLRSVPLAGCKSGPSKWLEDLSKSTSPLKSVQSLENTASVFEEPQVYGLIYPARSLLSDRLFEEISRKNEYSEPEKLRFRDQNNDVKIHRSLEAPTINMSSSKESYKADFKKSLLDNASKEQYTVHDPKTGVSKAESRVKPDTELAEVENKFLVKSGMREELLRNTINTYGKEIENNLLENNQLGQGLNVLNQALQSPAGASIGSLKSAETAHDLHKRAEDGNSSELGKNPFSIAEDCDPARHFKNLLSEKMNIQFSRQTQGIPALREALGKKPSSIADPNLSGSRLTRSGLRNHGLYSMTSFADYYTQAFESLEPDKQSVKNKELITDLGGVSEHLSRHVQGDSASKSLLEERIISGSGQHSYSLTDNTGYNAKDLKSKPDLFLERLKKQLDNRQFDKISVPDSNISEYNAKSELLSPTGINLLIGEAYSNSIKKSDLKEENKQLLLNLIENLNRITNQTNRDTTPVKQNTFNVYVSGENLVGEKDLKNLSDRLVMILKDQARRHGIDLS